MDLRLSQQARYIPPELAMCNLSLKGGERRTQGKEEGRLARRGEERRGDICNS